MKQIYTILCLILALTTAFLTGCKHYHHRPPRDPHHHPGSKPVHVRPGKPAPPARRYTPPAKPNRPAHVKPRSNDYRPAKPQAPKPRSNYRPSNSGKPDRNRPQSDKTPPKTEKKRR